MVHTAQRYLNVARCIRAWRERGIPEGVHSRKGAVRSISGTPVNSRPKGTAPPTWWEWGKGLFGDTFVQFKRVLNLTNATSLSNQVNAFFHRHKLLLLSLNKNVY
jgi:hypothetical protein